MMLRQNAQIVRGASSRRRSPAHCGNARSGGGRRFLPTFLGGAACGVAATIFVVLGLSPEAAPDPAPSERTTPEPFAFDFFEVLVRGQSEPVVVHDTSPLVPAEQEETAGATEYLLQAGSFRLRDDAERMRGWLMLYSGLPGVQGLSVTASAVELQEQGTWHRVLIGPFEDRDAVDQAMAHLRQRDVATLLLERPRG
ncbi:MAG: SPOR domain-containing protein [Gammaproteobacteria bacterium]|nr:SPOR domain-containing protein [Gammaproteobacteria bacterium]